MRSCEQNSKTSLRSTCGRSIDKCWSHLTCHYRFMSSEADLDADIKALSILSEHPELYEEFAKLGCVNSLVSLLSHENTDVAIDAVEIISELTDEDVEAKQGQWDALVDAMVSCVVGYWKLSDPGDSLRQVY